MGESFMFYGSYAEAIEKIPDEFVRVELMTAIIGYGAFGQEPENLSPYADAFFALVKPILDTNAKKKAGGSKGGRPRKNRAQNSSESESSEKDCENQNSNNGENHRFFSEESNGSELMSNQDVAEVFQTLEKCGFEINPHISDQFQGLLEQYGRHWTVEAIKRADENGKRSVSYVKGILKSWKSNGSIDRPGQQAPRGRNDLDSFYEMSSEWASEMEGASGT